MSSGTDLIINGGEVPAKNSFIEGRGREDRCQHSTMNKPGRIAFQGSMYNEKKIDAVWKHQRESVLCISIARRRFSP
jgi:hypothetical protein